jgi:hypothetical protein
MYGAAKSEFRRKGFTVCVQEFEEITKGTGFIFPVEELIKVTKGRDDVCKS